MRLSAHAPVGNNGSVSAKLNRRKLIVAVADTGLNRKTGSPKLALFGSQFNAVNGTGGFRKLNTGLFSEPEHCEIIVELFDSQKT